MKRHAIAGLTATLLSIAPLSPGLAQPVMAQAATDAAVAFQQNPLHDGFQAADPIAPPLARRWDRDLGGVVSYPLIAGGRIFVTVANTGAYPNFNYGATLHGLDEATGQDLWPPVPIASSSYWSSAAYDTSLVFASGSNDLYAVDPATGGVRWHTSLPNSNAPITASGGTVFVATQGDARAFHETDGSPAWPQAQVLVNDGGTGGPTVTTSGVYVDYACQNIYDLNPTNGSVLWTTVNNSPCHGGGGATSPIHNGRLYAQGPPGPTQSPTIYDAASGQTLGTYQADLNEAFDGNTALYSYGSTLRAQDLTTGSTRWSFNGDCDLLSAPVVANGYVYVGSTQGHIYAVNESTGQAVWQDTVGGPIIDPEYEGAPVGGLTIGEGLLAVPAFHHLVLYAPGAGGATPAGPGADAVTSYPPSGLTGQPQWLAKGPDGNIWATEFSGVVAPFHNRIARVTPAGGVTEFEVSTTDNRDLTGITAGSDGALWFTEQAASKVGRITTGGQITEYVLPTVFPGYGTSYPPEPYGIASGPDGALWITLAGFNQVARMTTAGVLTNQFQLPGDPPGSEQPHGITTGPDGNLWFTEAQGQKIGRLTPTGTLTEFPVPTITAAESPESIVTGSDNNLWFTVPGNGDPRSASPPALRKIGRVTTGGVFSYFDAPTPWSSPWGIASGPDGALWFTEHRAFGHTPEKVGRITTAGIASEYWVPGGAQLLSGIVAGADGNLWFGQSNLNRIDRLVPQNDACPSSPAAPTPTPTPTPAPTPTPTPTPNASSRVSTSQYRLANSDGSTWVDIDATQLADRLSPTANAVATLSANADLWTANAGYNQDLGIFVSTNGGPDTLVAWKESGGRGATFSPNAAYVQTVLSLAGGSTYLVKLKWKTNRPSAGATIFAGAGLGPVFSPTSLTVHLRPSASDPGPAPAISTSQYRLAGSDGQTWQDVDPAHLTLSITPTVASSAVIGGNADLWTANDGVNQDIGIWVSGGTYGSGQVVAWKESGGNAGTFSPNAAFVQAVLALDPGTTYTVTMRWKANHVTGGTIFAGAGEGPSFSPTSLIAELITAAGNPHTQVSGKQYKISNSDGTTWVAVDPALDVSISAGGTNAVALVSANADLWTANAGYDQDIGIFVSVNGGPESLVVWKESGGYGGTFSPNAAFAQALYPMSAGNSYVFRLRWKANRAASGATIFAGAGLGPVFSPTRLTVETL